MSRNAVPDSRLPAVSGGALDVPLRLRRAVFHFEGLDRFNGVSELGKRRSPTFQPPEQEHREPIQLLQQKGNDQQCSSHHSNDDLNPEKNIYECIHETRVLSIKTLLRNQSFWRQQNLIVVTGCDWDDAEKAFGMNDATFRK